MRLKRRENEDKQNIFFTQLHYYRKLALMIRYIFISQGMKGKAFYQKLLNLIRQKYRKVLVMCKEHRKKIKRWIIMNEKKNKTHEIERGKANAAKTHAIKK